MRSDPPVSIRRPSLGRLLVRLAPVLATALAAFPIQATPQTQKDVVVSFRVANVVDSSAGILRSRRTVEIEAPKAKTQEKQIVAMTAAASMETGLDVVYRQWLECALLVGNLSTRVGTAAYDLGAAFTRIDEPSDELATVIRFVSDRIEEWGQAMLGVSDALRRMRVELEGKGSVAAYGPTGRGCPAPMSKTGGGRSFREALGLPPIAGQGSPARTNLDRVFRLWLECTLADGMFGMQGGSKGARIKRVRENDPGQIGPEAHAALRRFEGLLDELHLANSSLTQMRGKLWVELDKRGIVTPYEPALSGCPV